MWYDWNTIPPLIRWRIRGEKDQIKYTIRHELLRLLIKGTVTGCITWPEFLPKWRLPKTSDVPKYIPSDQALNKYRDLWQYEVPVCDAQIFIGKYNFLQSACKVVLWCARNCKARYHIHLGAGLTVWFESGTDASLFKLFHRPSDNEFIFLPKMTNPCDAPVV